MKGWQRWVLVILAFVVVAAILAATRYRMQCVAVRDFDRGAIACRVLDRWTGEVRR